MKNIVISGTGLYTPPHAISNEELVDSFNQYVDKYNLENAGKSEPLRHSSCDFILKAAGIEKRYVVEKSGILDIECMRPKLSERSNEEHSIQGEMGIQAGLAAIKAAGLRSDQIDAVIVASSNIQRPYPAIAVEIQNGLNISGYGFDMNAGCASAAFAIQVAYDHILRGQAKAVLIVNPEICSGHINFRDRESHFIFGDACTALVVQDSENLASEHAFSILGTRLKTQFSNNIRNNFGFLAALNPECLNNSDKLFSQQGRKVFKEVVPFVADVVQQHIKSLGITTSDLKRLWLHQANSNMNRLISTKILDREPEDSEAPLILNEYGNTSSPGAVIAFHKHHRDLKSGDIGLLCAFGAGYSVGNVILQKC